MGLEVVNCEEAIDVVMVDESENEEMRGGGEGSGPAAAGRWDLSNPLRILLVEADDSTRHIIGALLRKCNYKVASVSDGLKAWDVLKAKHNSIDVVLTEVELPSISGYALLSLITEHEFCKNIPVIMMSTQDSVNTVYKCMLRGAADFLVKPIRINELRNLWQHVWRRQSMNCEGLVPQDESLTHETLEATATSDQSSIKNQDLDAKSTYKAEEESPDSDLKSSQNLCTPENENICPEADTGNLCDSSREAIDLMGNFDDNHSRQNLYSGGESTGNFDCSRQLDLSLRRYQPVALEINTTQEKQMINHSNASPFTLYSSNSNGNTNAKDTMSLSMNLEKEGEDHALHRLFPIPRACPPSPSSQSPCSGNQQIDYCHQFSNQCINSLDNNLSVSSNQPMRKQEQGLGSSEDGSQFTARADQSSSSALSNGTATQHSNGSNSNDAVVPDNGSEPQYYKRSSHREAALNKFRLKRKERCFEKKVRYESRKKLAEQRPRVKGQFVRQAPCDPSSTDRS